jgi:single-strand DNA-binding protein
MFLNRVEVIGNLTADPEIRVTPKGHKVVNLCLGVNEFYETESGEKRQVSTFVDVRFWGPTAERLVELAKKGVEIFVEGRLREDRWEDADTHEPRKWPYVKGERWQFTQYRTPRAGDQVQSGEESPPAKAEPPPPPTATVEPAAVPPAPAAKRKMSKRTKPASA